MIVTRGLGRPGGALVSLGYGRVVLVPVNPGDISALLSGQGGATGAMTGKGSLQVIIYGTGTAHGSLTTVLPSYFLPVSGGTAGVGGNRQKVLPLGARARSGVLGEDIYRLTGRRGSSKAVGQSVLSNQGPPGRTEAGS